MAGHSEHVDYYEELLDIRVTERERERARVTGAGANCREIPEKLQLALVGVFVTVIRFHR